MKPANAVLSNTGTTIFETMSRLAQAHGAINLGQGFPEGLEPAEVIAAAARALTEGPHQYPPMTGIPELRQAVSDHAKRFYGLAFDPASEVLVTSGATEALAVCIMGLIEPGDEAVLLEPAFDTYAPVLRRAGAVVRSVRLAPPDWSLPRAELEAAFGPKTKLLILNSPMNPNGKVFTPDELAFIAGLLQRHDAYCICDEVYEHLVYDGLRHIPLMTLPGMRERCLRIGSAGKTFSVTGWKVGYVSGAAAVLQPALKAHQYMVFSTPPALQKAIAFGLGQGDGYFHGLREGLQARRDLLAKGLAEAGFGVLPCAGSYFLSADYSGLGFEGDDLSFCRHMTEKAGVAAIPMSAFYATDAPGRTVRFCFAKTEPTLIEAISRLRRFFSC